MAAGSGQVDTVAARRPVAGVTSFTVHPEPVSPIRLRLAGVSALVRDRWVLAALGACAVLLAGAADVALSRTPAAVAEPPAAPPDAPAPGPVWIEVNRPIRLFDLSGSSFGKLPLAYRARRLSDGSERRDTLTYGTFEADAPALTLSILRAGPAGRAAALATDLARVADPETLATASGGASTPVRTRFGTVEAADLTVVTGAKPRPCLAFRLRAGDAAPVAMAGLACGTPAKPVDRARLACVLDRLDLLSAGEDTALRDFFVEAERHRGQGCGGAGLLVAGARGTWLDGEAVRPPLERAGP